MIINYFELFNIPAEFKIDVKTINDKYFALQKEYHPDRFAGKDEAGRLQALQTSADINEGYNILKDPIKRAEHLLSIHKVKDVNPSQNFLSEMMDLGEALEELGNDEAIDNFISDLTYMLDESLDEFAAAFTSKDFETAAIEIVRAKFIARLIENAELHKVII